MPMAPWVVPFRCLLVTDTKRTFSLGAARSGIRRKADMPNQHVECPLMTQSGRSAATRSPKLAQAAPRVFGGKGS